MTTKSTDIEIAASGSPTILRRDTTPTIFADGLLGGSIDAGVVRLELLARHLDAESQSLSPALVGRLVMPVESLTTFVAALAALAGNANGAKKQAP